ncbi:MAG: L-threonylcarbamoyladenylate synthase [Kastovskya adunca ATA6-11-RM4]|jgi:L-threonylcarbamoyladenylate synthase|nr:L-threonylcarbamoyladenylate synthase [Kastovskya adunca ATA6-11-RM4]
MTLVSMDALVAGAIAGRVVSFPTDTVPALAVQPEQASLIFAAKQRSLDKPLILMGASPRELWSFASASPQELEIWQQVAERYWPGALTLVLPASDKVPPAMNPTEPTTIGLRVPNHRLAQMILSQTGAMATTSANRSGEPPLQSLREISATFPEVLALQPEGVEAEQPASMGVPSTVVKWMGSGWEILREGSINFIGVG